VLSNGAGDAVGERTQAHALVTVPPPLKLPGREPANVDVELVEAGVVAIMGELDLELHLVARDGQFSDGADRTDTGSTPSAVRSAVRELPSVEYLTGLRTYSLLVHLAGSAGAPRPWCGPASAGRPSQMPSGWAPVASDKQGPRGGINSVALIGGRRSARLLRFVNNRA
jgi:hypothetical protein